MLVFPEDTAAKTDAVKKASVIGSISTCGIAFSWPTGGPRTVVEYPVCSTVQPIGRRTSTAKRASPWRDLDPMFGIVQVVPVIAANANGYVAELASDSTTYSAGFLY